jgi:hypothetical protein
MRSIRGIWFDFVKFIHLNRSNIPSVEKSDGNQEKLKKTTVVIELSHNEARNFFLKEKNYCDFPLPNYFTFQKLLDKISKVLQGKEIKCFYDRNKSPRDCENVNYKLLSNKDGKFAWRPLQLIHPAIYVSLVHKITEEENWQKITNKIKEFTNNDKIQCISIPVESNNDLSDKAALINTWWDLVEQKSIYLALKFEYILHTDISNCYSSIYTHSIVWALHTKEVAKNNKKGNLVGNVIDWHLQDMSFGQTNGIPQGSVLMDFIAEIILCCVDYELSNKLVEINVVDYQIIRYRDDYRIFTNNPQSADLIVKNLTDILSSFNLQLNPQKTFSSDSVIRSSIKQDKLYYILNPSREKDLQKHLIYIHDLSYKHPNSGSLVKALNKFFNRIEHINKIWGDRDSILVLVSILVNITYRNPKVYPISFAILSKLLSLIKYDNDKKQVVKDIIERFKNMPNIGFLEIWLQRITLKIEDNISFRELLCKKVTDENHSVSLWNSEWMLQTNKLHEAINNTAIIDKKIIEKMNQVIQDSEVKLFGSKNSY